MARKSENDLYELIKSLTKGERKTFTLFANYYSSGSKKYLLLFSLIDSQKQYNEDVIKQKLNEEKILTPLAGLKIYLMELILKALRFHHSGNNIDRQIQDLISDIILYHAKGLVKHRDKALIKAKQQARFHEKHELYLQLLNKEWGYRQGAERNQIFSEQKRITEKLNNIRKYQRLHQIIDVLFTKGAIRNEKDKEEWDKIIEDPVMNKNIEPSGFEECFYYHHIFAAYYHYTNEPVKSINHREILIKKMESRPDLLSEMYTRYMVLLTNTILLHVSNKDIGSAKQVMKKLLLMRDWNLNSVEINHLENQLTLAYSLLIYCNIILVDFEAGKRAAAEVIRHLENKQIDPYYKSMMVMALSTLYMYTGEYHKALGWNNILLHELSKNYREDMDAIVRISNVIIHFELGNDDILPHIIRSTYRFMYKKNRLFKTEDAILRFIRNKLSKSNSRKDVLQFFKELKTELEEISKDPYEANAYGDFNYIAWLASKIENKSMLEILSQQKDHMGQSQKN